VGTRYARSVLTVTTAVVAALFGVTTVLAATTWTVRPGGPVSLKSGRFMLKDTRSGVSLTCLSSTLGGTLKSGSGLSGSTIGSMAAVTFTGCSVPLGPGFTLRARDLPWHLNFSSYDATTGVVTGSISHFQMTLSFAGGICTAAIDGTSGTASNGNVKVTYTNSTAKLKALTTGGNLHFYNVKGCFGEIATNDPAAIAATYTVSPRQTITSP
jgi:hypothetical protein